MMSALALLLSDARFPSGGHAHSGGTEQACDSGLVYDLDSLAAFLQGRLVTVGVVAAHAASLVCARPASWVWVDAELDARSASPAARAVSRLQGAQLLRAARTVFPGMAELPVLSLPREPHHAGALGAVASAAGLVPLDAAALAAYGSVAGAASAALRLLGLDPSGVARVLAALAPQVDSVAATAAELGRLPSNSAPMLDLLAEEHSERKERLFAS